MRFGQCCARLTLVDCGIAVADAKIRDRERRRGTELNVGVVYSDWCCLLVAVHALLRVSMGLTCTSPFQRLDAKRADTSDAKVGTDTGRRCCDIRARGFLTVAVLIKHYGGHFVPNTSSKEAFAKRQKDSQAILFSLTFSTRVSLANCKTTSSLIAAPKQRGSSPVINSGDSTGLG